ncbi:MAG: glycosyltransferase family 4 protein [Bacteroidia bacterium]|nr:glycosyltransferase family 4 protein [Bacteroidia bacterium]
MRIGFDAKRYYHNRTGLGNYARSLVDGFIEHHPEHDYILFTPKLPKSLRTKPSNTVTRRKLSPFWRQFGITSDIDRNKLDIYHGLSAELPGIKPQKSKLVVTIHDLIFMKYPSYYSTIDRLIYSRKTSGALSSADAIVATSQQTKRDIEAILGKEDNRIQVIYQDCAPLFYHIWGVEELGMLSDRYRLPAKFLLMVSKFEKRKNHSNLLRALAASGIDIPLVCVGNKGDAFDDVVKLRADLGLTSQVQLIEGVPSHDLPGFYQASSGSVFPSEYEGFGIPVLESMASHTPVLTSKDSCMQEICGPAAMYFDPHSVEDMVEKLKVFVEGSTYSELFEKIHDRLPQFSTRHILEQHLTLYKSLL